MPDWLCDVEPLEPGGPRPSITFGGDVIVVETDAAFWIIVAGLPPGDAQIEMGSTHGKKTQAYPTNKPLIWATQFKTWPTGRP